MCHYMEFWKEQKQIQQLTIKNLNVCNLKYYKLPANRRVNKTAVSHANASECLQL